MLQTCIFFQRWKCYFWHEIFLLNYLKSHVSHAYHSNRVLLHSMLKLAKKACFSLGSACVNQLCAVHDTFYLRTVCVCLCGCDITPILFYQIAAVTMQQQRIQSNLRLVQIPLMKLHYITRSSKDKLHARQRRGETTNAFRPKTSKTKITTYRRNYKAKERRTEPKCKQWWSKLQFMMINLSIETKEEEKRTGIKYMNSLCISKWIWCASCKFFSFIPDRFVFFDWNFVRWYVAIVKRWW